MAQQVNYTFVMAGLKSKELIMQWLNEQVVWAPGQVILRQELFELHQAYCSARGIQAAAPAAFGRLVKAVFPEVTAARLGPRNGNKMCHRHVAYRSALLNNSATVVVKKETPSPAPSSSPPNLSPSSSWSEEEPSNSTTKPKTRKTNVRYNPMPTTKSESTTTTTTTTWPSPKSPSVTRDRVNMWQALPFLMSASLLEGHQVTSWAHLAARWILEDFLLKGNAEGLNIGHKLLTGDMSPEDCLFVVEMLERFKSHHQLQVSPENEEENRNGSILLMLTLAWWAGIYHSDEQSCHLTRCLLLRAKTLLADKALLSDMACLLLLTLTMERHIAMTETELSGLRSGLQLWASQGPSSSSDRRINSMKHTVGSILDNAARALDETTPSVTRVEHWRRLSNDLAAAPGALVACGLFELQCRGVLEKTIRELSQDPAVISSLLEKLLPFGGMFQRVSSAATPDWRLAFNPVSSPTWDELL